MQDIAEGKDAQVAAAGDVIVALDADILWLTGIDHDSGEAALSALAAALERKGARFPYRMALRPNTGVQTGLDLDGDGQRGGPGDAQGFGRFSGEGAMAVLSRLPIDRAAVRDFSGLLWADLPGNIAPDLPPEQKAVQRLSTTGHWEVPVILPGGGRLRLLGWYASPPVFDGPEDRNGRRNHDEAAFWLRLLAGDLPLDPPAPPFVILGQSNLDPMDGDGRRAAMAALLAHPALTDPAPRGTHGRTEPDQTGDPALDTALYREGIGGLRVEVVLPSRDLAVMGSGVLWPPEGDRLARVLRAASRHYPLWVDVALP